MMKSSDDGPSSSHMAASPQETVTEHGETSNFVDEECPNCTNAREVCRRAMLQCFSLSSKLEDFERLKPENEELLQRVGSTDTYVIELLGKYNDVQSSNSSLQAQLDAALIREKDMAQQLAILEKKQEFFSEGARKHENNQEKLLRMSSASTRLRMKAEEQFETISKLNGVVETQQKRYEELKNAHQKLEAEKSLWKSQISTGKKYLPPIFDVINDIACSDTFSQLALKLRKKIDRIRHSDAQMILLGTTGRTISDDEAARNLEMLLMDDMENADQEDPNTLTDDGNLPPSVNVSRKESSVNDGSSRKRGNKDAGRGKVSKPQTMDINTLNKNAEIALQRKVHRADSLPESTVSTSTIHGRKMPSVKEQQQLSNALTVKDRVRLMREKNELKQKENVGSSSPLIPRNSISTTHGSVNTLHKSESRLEEIHRSTVVTQLHASSDSKIVTEVVQSLVCRTAGLLSKRDQQAKTGLKTTNATGFSYGKLSNVQETNRVPATIDATNGMEKQLSRYIRKIRKEIGDPIRNVASWPETLDKLSVLINVPVDESTQNGISLKNEEIIRPSSRNMDIMRDSVFSDMPENQIQVMITCDAGASQLPSVTNEDSEAHASLVTVDSQLPETSFPISPKRPMEESSIDQTQPHEESSTVGSADAVTMRSKINETKKISPRKSRSKLSDDELHKSDISRRTSLRSKSVMTSVMKKAPPMEEVTETPHAPRLRLRSGNPSVCSSEKSENSTLADDIIREGAPIKKERRSHFASHNISVAKTSEKLVIAPEMKKTSTVEEITETLHLPLTRFRSRNPSLCSPEKSKNSTLGNEAVGMDLPVKKRPGRPSKRKLDTSENVSNVSLKVEEDVIASRRTRTSCRKSMVPVVESSPGVPVRILRSSTPLLPSHKKDVPSPMNDSTSLIDDEPGPLIIMDDNIDSDVASVSGEDVSNLPAATHSRSNTSDNGEVSREEEAATSEEVNENLPSTSKGLISILPISLTERRNSNARKVKGSIISSMRSALDKGADLKTVATRLKKQVMNQKTRVTEVPIYHERKSSVHKMSTDSTATVAHAIAKKPPRSDLASSAPMKRRFLEGDTLAVKKACPGGDYDGNVIQSERLLDAVLSLTPAEIEKLPTERIDLINSIKSVTYVEAFCMFLLKRTPADHWYFISDAFKKKRTKDKIQLNNSEEETFLQNAVTLANFDLSLFWFPFARELVKVINSRTSVCHSLYARVIRVTAHCLRFDRKLTESTESDKVKTLLQSLFWDIIDRNDADRIMVFFLICFDEVDISFVATGDYLKQLRLLSSTSKSQILSWAFRLAFPDSANVTLDRNDELSCVSIEESILNSLDCHSFTIGTGGKVMVSENLLYSLNNFAQLSVREYFHHSALQRKNMRDKWASNLTSLVDELHMLFKNPQDSGVFADSVPCAPILDEKRAWRISCTLQMITAIFVDIYSFGNEGKSFVIGISDQMIPALSMVREIRISIKHAVSTNQSDKAASQLYGIIEYALNIFCKFSQRLTRFPIDV